jgi:hypothetical protein
MRQVLFAFVIATSSIGCMATVTGSAGGDVIVEDPPAPREEPIEVRAGFVFVQGHWYRAGGRWEWQAGHYERERANAHWVTGRWERRGNGHDWVEGRWESGGGAEVRDHRGEGGTEVRDHR